MSKHTPGPWKTNTAGSAGPWPAPFKITEIYVYAPDTQDDVAVCSEIIDPVTQEPSKANARLIAAAPCLLEALQSLVEQLEDGAYAGETFADDHPMVAARAAIAKATQ